MISAPEAGDILNPEFLRQRPEQLSVDEFVRLTNQVELVIGN